MHERSGKSCREMARGAPMEVYWYEVDRGDRLVAASDNWNGFAACNGAVELTIEAIRGKPIWQYIADPTTREIYRDLFAEVRRTGEPITICYRCDSPELRRDMELRIETAASNGLRIESRIVHVEPHETGTILRDDVERDARMVEACSFCKKVKVAERGWMELSDAAQRGAMFSEATVPQLSHSVCPACEPELQARLGLPSS